MRKEIAITCAALLATPLAGSLDAQAAGAAEIPRLSFAEFGWFPVSDDFEAPKSGPGPVVSDPAHPYFSNQSGVQPTDRVADVDNPILQPWVVERLKKSNQIVLTGKTPFNPRERCMPGGVPGVDIYSRLRPVYLLQTPKEVVFINEGDAQVRHIYLNVPHSKNPKPSWYGESVGHYEGGDTLVVDTIGLNDKTFIDNYLTPHTEKLHVVERFRLLPDGKTLRVTITVDDPGAFTTVWTAYQTYQQRPQPKMLEAACAENPTDYLQASAYPLPHADKPDF
jgi:hypothetical protein